MMFKKIWPGLLAACMLCLALPVAGQVKKKPLPGVRHKMKPVLSPSKTKPAPTKPVHQGPAPVISCSQPEHDFKTAVQGTSVVHTFTLKNKGKGVLKIERARGG